jgi:hypothetical protein
VTAGNRVRVSRLLLILKWSISESSRITSYYKSHPTSPSSGQAAVCSQLRHSILSACHSGAALGGAWEHHLRAHGASIKQVMNFQ